MDHWLPIMFEPEDQILDIARAAEAAGFRGVALADHVAVPVGFDSVHPSGENPFDHSSSFPDPVATAAAILAVTTRLEVLTYVYIVTMREPFSVAKQAGTLAVLSDGRFRLGVGAGWLREEIALLGQDPSVRGRRMDEMLDVTRRFLAEGVVEHHGEFFDFGPTGMYPKPAVPPPIWVGGKSDVALARACRHDGWMGMNYEVDEMWDLLEQLDEHRRIAGTTGSPFETLVIPNAAPDRSLHEEMSARGVSSTVSMPWYPGDPTYADVGAKSEALTEFARAFMAGA